MRLVPRLWLLKRKKRTQIFQLMGVRAIVSTVLGEVGIATRWQLRRDYPIRQYCTQDEESDYRFIAPLLAESGIYFVFPQGPLDEDGSAAAPAMVPANSLIFSDDPTGYPPIGGDDREEASAASEAPSLDFLSMQQTPTSHSGKVPHCSLRTSTPST